jgi:hypothetical protein
MERFRQVDRGTTNRQWTGHESGIRRKLSLQCVRARGSQSVAQYGAKMATGDKLHAAIF